MSDQNGTYLRRQADFSSIRVKQDGCVYCQSAPAVATATASLTQEPVVSFGALGAGLMLWDLNSLTYSPLTVVNNSESAVDHQLTS